MAFTGFNTKYPEYEIITPQTKHSFTVRSLNVQEEERLKGSLVTPQKVTEHLNKCVFDAIVEKPEAIKTFDDFLKKVTLKDRDALLYGLYHVTYEEIRNYELTCTSCGEKHQVTVKASDTFGFNPFPKDNVLKDRAKVKLPATKGVEAVVKQPTLRDEVDAIRNLGSRPGSTLEIITETLIIDQFEEESPESKEPSIWKDRVDILDAYMTLPARDKRVIYRAYDEAFGQYGVELKMKAHCPSCSKEDIYNIDLVESFFRSMYSA